MKASYFGSMGYADRHKFPADWPVPPSHHQPAVAMRSYQEGLEECEYAEDLGFDWISISEHHFSGNRTTPNPAVMAGVVAERCKKARIALLGQLLPLLNPVRAAEELGMLDNLTGGRLVMGFMRGTLTEDQSYGMNPAESRERLLEAMDLVLRALTEPQPFSWEGRFYRFPTVSVWPHPVQQPLPPVIVATRSDDTVRYAAHNRLGLGIAYDRVDHVAEVASKYRHWCQEAGWQPTPDQVVYRGSIYLAETDQAAADRLQTLGSAGLGGRGLTLRPSIAQAVQAALTGREFNPRQPAVGDPRRNAVRDARGLISFAGSPDTVCRQLKEFHDQCGVGVVDFGFQQPGITHQEVMGELKLFGREVLPRMREF